MSESPFEDRAGRIWGVRRSTLSGLQLIRDAGPVFAPIMAVVSVIEGIVPVLFTLQAGNLVAVSHDLDAGGTSALHGPLAVVAGLFLAGEVLQHFRFALLEGFRHRVDGRRRERAMAAALRPTGIAHLEDPAVLDVVKQAARTEWPDTSAFTVGVFGMITSRTVALASAGVVATFRWWLALGLLVVWAWAGRVMRRGQAESFADTAGKLRRAEYIRELAFEPLAAKEIRVFGFGTWLRDTFSAGWMDVMTGVWRKRRGTRSKQVSAFAVVLGANVVAFALVVASARSGSLPVAHLVVVAPSILALSRFGQTDEYTLSFALGAVALPYVETAERMLSEPRYDAPGSLPAEGLPGREIRFENVSFSYASRPDTAVYRGLDLRIEAGKSLAIVGANGAGKTTLVKLLARLYEPTDGRITVDGVRLTGIAPEQWQRRVAAIFQDFTRYELTAADNVGFGGIDRLGDVPALESAAERVGSLELIRSLPHGWGTVLSRRYEDGTDLSGGEWQRVALARALFAIESGASVLVLDEPTANLDVRAEVELFDRFLDVTRGATTILISHRFSTVRRADRIVVLVDGRVAEEGSHEELVDLGRVYARSFRMQADRYDDVALEAMAGDG